MINIPSIDISIPILKYLFIKKMNSPSHIFKKIGELNLKIDQYINIDSNLRKQYI